jgi:excinuclease ABC subunit A
VGLGYIRLGQPLSTLSGGEAQRLKLSRHLRSDDGRRGRTLFIFDEPTTGLHFEDIRTLLGCLQRLVEAGHSVLVIEHNLDVVKTADWVIDLGPEGGDAGGQIVATGPPEHVTADDRSHTGRFLKAYLNGKGRLKTASPSVSQVAEPAAAYSARESARMIEIKGAREHNLKDIHLSLPHNQLVVLTGVSGSGKSTLAFDILFAEGQRRYLESLAPYVRQYMKIMERPDVDLVTGLAPTVAIEQRISHAGRRSTVATLTETYHFLRLLYSKLGTQHCPGCDRPLTAQTQAAIVEQVRDRYGHRPAKVLALKVLGHKELLERAVKKGFTEARIDGSLTRLTAGMALARYHEHTIELVAGSLPVRDLAAFIARSLDEGGGHICVIDGRGREEVFSLHGICPACGIGLEPLDPRLFSFNSKQGACPTCNGLGVTIADEEDEAVGESPVCRTCGGSRPRPWRSRSAVAPSGTWCNGPPARCSTSSAALSF